ncbi:MAG TPA: tetratricopeptide repeat protein [Blastocatellia bacterium]|nr:tetratricopeptide repeat protein [Blastocatellia bacterium]
MITLTSHFNRNVIFTLLLCCALPLSVWGQTGSDYEAMKQEAIRLYQQNRLTDVLPLAEKLYAQNPKDPQMLELYAFSVLASAQTIKDTEGRKQARKRARELAVKAKELGNDSNLLQVVLDIPPDGGEDNFSARKDVEAAMREGEAAFVRGDFKKALAAYQLALQLDPKLYHAALFCGDVYYKQGDANKAGEWFTKAIAIDPDTETAYRYWGDVLMQLAGKKEEARDKFVDAIIAEPYNRRAWMGLIQWAEKYGVQLAHPKVVIPTSVSKEPDKDGKKQTSITLDVNSMGEKDGTSAWLFYGIARSTWMNGEFLKEYPKEKTYRHSLGEETAALTSVVEAARNTLKANKNNAPADVSIANLIQLHQAGLLEPYILLVQADQGIAQDYADYRQVNRDKVRRYLQEVVLHGGQIKK